MSLKVYIAYRCNLEDLEKVIELVYEKAVPVMQQRLIRLFFSKLKNSEEDLTMLLEMFNQDGSYNAESFNMITLLRLWKDTIETPYYTQLKSLENNIYDFDVSLYINFYKGKAYIRPRVGDINYKVLDFVSEITYLEDYSAWDNVDAPEDVLEEDWQERVNVWYDIDTTKYTLEYPLFSTNNEFSVFRIMDEEEFKNKIIELKRI